MRGTIIIAGDFIMPDKNAAASRVLGLAYALEAKDYQIVFQGKNTEYNRKNCSYNSIGPFTWKARPVYKRAEYYCDCSYLIDTVEELGANEVKAIILYHQPSISALRFLRYCKKQGIILITDTTEWYSLFQMKANKHAILTIADFYFRMLYVNYKVHNMIVISSYLKNYYQTRGANVIQIPILNISNLQQLEDRTWNHPRICYCGSPAKKDMLGPVIAAVQHINDLGKKLELHIVGVSEEDISHFIIDDLSCENIFCYGRLEHSDAVSVLRHCDFSIIIRKNERYAKAGFPTKMVEAFSNGVGVIATPNGDIPNYVKNDVNGYLVDFKSIDKDLEFLFEHISHFPNEKITSIKTEALMTAKRFMPELYADEFNNLIKD